MPDAAAAPEVSSEADDDSDTLGGGSTVDLVRVERLERAVDLGRCGAHFEGLVAYARTAVQGCVWGPVWQCLVTLAFFS